MLLARIVPPTVINLLTLIVRSLGDVYLLTMSGAQAAPAASPASPDRSISPPRSVSLPTLPNVQITHASFSNPIPGNGNPGVGKSTTESSSSTAMGTSARDSPSHAHHNNVLSRLSHLFHHEHANAQASSPGHSEPVAFPPNDDLDSDFGAEDSNAEKRSPQPQDPSPDAPRPQAPDRDAIKILVVTWNMGDALVCCLAFPPADLLAQGGSLRPTGRCTGVPANSRARGSRRPPATASGERPPVSCRSLRRARMSYTQWRTPRPWRRAHERRRTTEIGGRWSDQGRCGASKGAQGER